MKKEDRETNWVRVTINTESGCNPKDDEYSMFLVGLVGALDIHYVNDRHGVSDISLIREAISNDFDFDLLPKEGYAVIDLRESGEREDVYWNKYYVIEQYVIKEC